MYLEAFFSFDFQKDYRYIAYILSLILELFTRGS